MTGRRDDRLTVSPSSRPPVILSSCCPVVPFPRHPMLKPFAIAALAATFATAARAQTMSHESMSHETSATKLSADEITALAKLQAELDRARDTLQAQMAAPRNDKDEAQQSV